LITDAPVVVNPEIDSKKASTGFKWNIKGIEPKKDINSQLNPTIANPSLNRICISALFNIKAIPSIRDIKEDVKNGVGSSLKKIAIKAIESVRIENARDILPNTFNTTLTFTTLQIVVYLISLTL